MTIDRIIEEIRHGTLAAGILVALIGGAGAQSTGSITGTVTTKASGATPLRVTIDQGVCGNELPDESVTIDAQGRLANAVVTLVGVKAKAAAAGASVMNEKCRFTPRVQIVKPNSMITTSSRDPILHTTNAQVANGKTLFNVAVPVPGININKSVSGAGLVRLSCNTHPWMRGWMVVTDDLSAVTHADGRFHLGDVPAGTYELRIWHESLKGESRKVTIAPGQPVTVDFELR